MQRYEPLTESLCNELSAEVSALIAPLAERYGICLDFVKDVCSETGDSVAINAKFSLPQRPDSVATLKEEQDFRCYAEGFGMRASWLGQEFKRGNLTYKVVGLMVNAPNECAVLQRSDGARCHENGKLVARYLG